MPGLEGHPQRLDLGKGECHVSSQTPLCHFRDISVCVRVHVCVCVRIYNAEMVSLVWVSKVSKVRTHGHVCGQRSLRTLK